MQYTTKLGLQCDISPMPVSDKDTFMRVRKVMKCLSSFEEAESGTNGTVDIDAMMDAQADLMDAFGDLTGYMNMQADKFTLADVAPVITILQTGELPSLEEDGPDPTEATA